MRRSRERLKTVAGQVSENLVTMSGDTTDQNFPQEIPLEIENIINDGNWMFEVEMDGNESGSGRGSDDGGYDADVSGSDTGHDNRSNGSP